MRMRTGNRASALEVRALYTVTALARASNVSHQSLRRLFEKLGVKCLRVGRTVLVPLSEIEEKVEPLWASIVAAESVRAAANESSSVLSVPSEKGGPRR